MILPFNGSIVVIDDKVKQARPILDAFSKKGLSTIYFTGNEIDLPEEPIQGVRIVIADLQLSESDNDPHTIATRLVNILQRIISPKNGPYILIIWSLKKTLYGSEVKKEVNKIENSVVPICTVDLEKGKCIAQQTGDDIKLQELRKEVFREFENSLIEESDLEQVFESISRHWVPEVDSEYIIKENAISFIEENVESELRKAGVFHLFILWENLIKKAAAETVSSISEALDMDEYWEVNMRDVFRRMGVARVGQNDVSETDLIQASVLTFIETFKDKLEINIKEQELPEYITVSGDNLIRIKEEDNEVRIAKQDQVFVIHLNEIQIATGGNFKTLKNSINKISDDSYKRLANLVYDKYISISPKLNTSLHLESNPSDEHIPGNVYIIPIGDDETKRKYAKTYFKNIPDESLKDIQFIELEVSPICDYAQKKWKKSRLVSGIVYPENLKVEDRNHFYRVEPIFYLDNGLKKIAFDCHLFKSLDHDIVKSRTIKYRLRRELLLDIIAQVSAHVNRPGISFVN